MLHWSLLTHVLILPTVYRYGSSLETGSARFSQPGDFFVYLVFVASVILVSGSLDPEYPDRVADFLLRFLPCHPCHLAYLPAQPLLAEAVPGSEEDCPRISCSTAYSQNPMVLYAVRERWEYL